MGQFENFNQTVATEILVVSLECLYNEETFEIISVHHQIVLKCRTVLSAIDIAKWKFIPHY